jgi:hypothetical protein
MRSARTAVECGTVALFLLALCSPLADQCIRPSSAREPKNENRPTRPLPRRPRTAADLSRFPQEFEEHYADTFGLRDVLLRWNSLLKLCLFRVSPAPILALDDSGWVDYTGESTMEIRRGVMPMSTWDLKEWTDYIALCRDFCARNGAQYVFLTVPNKETIYPDHVPARYAPFGPSRLDQIVAALPDDLRPAFIDPRAEFVAARAGDHGPWDYLYNLYGTHWNGRGTWVAYLALMRDLQSSRNDVVPLRDDEIAMTLLPGPAIDTWGPRMYLPDRFLHPAEYPAVRGPQSWQEIESVQSPVVQWFARNPHSQGPRVVVFHDSFGPPLEVLFANTFSEVTFVHGWFAPAIVLSRRPDIVVEERVERIFAGTPILPDVGRRIMEQKTVPPDAGELILSIDATAPESALATIGRARFERKPDGLAFRAEDSKAGWLLPPFTLPAGRRAWMLVDFESQERGMLIAYRKSNATGEWLRRDAAYLPFDAGSTRRTVALEGPSGPREIRLNVSVGPTGIMVRRIEVRTTKR